jgi:hypothetical protein
MKTCRFNELFPRESSAVYLLIITNIYIYLCYERLLDEGEGCLRGYGLYFGVITGYVPSPCNHNAFSYLATWYSH